MAIALNLKHTDVARSSMERSGIELANANAFNTLNYGSGSGAIAIGTTTSKVTLGATTSYFINGVIYSKSSGADIWTLSGTTVAANSFQSYLLMLDASG